MQRLQLHTQRLSVDNLVPEQNQAQRGADSGSAVIAMATGKTHDTIGVSPLVLWSQLQKAGKTAV